MGHAGRSLPPRDSVGVLREDAGKVVEGVGGGTTQNHTSSLRQGALIPATAGSTCPSASRGYHCNAH